MTFNHNFTRHFCILLIFFFCFIFILIFKYFRFVFSFSFTFRISFSSIREKDNLKFPFDYYNCWNNHHRFNWWIWIANVFEFHSWLPNSKIRLIKTKRPFWCDRDIIIKMEILFDGFSIWKFVKNKRPFEKLANLFLLLRCWFWSKDCEIICILNNLIIKKQIRIR